MITRRVALRKETARRRCWFAAYFSILWIQGSGFGLEGFAVWGLRFSVAEFVLMLLFGCVYLKDGPRLAGKGTLLMRSHGRMLKTVNQ